jgi:hypothetical protein
MSKTCLALLFFLTPIVLAQQQDPEHPWPSHEPPPNYFCVPAKDDHAQKTDIHACACLGMMMKKMCGDTPEEDEAQRNSAKCKAWCKPDQCKCAMQCKDSRVMMPSRATAND